MPLRPNATLQNTVTDAIVDAVDAGAAAGKVKIYTGSQPASPAVAATGTLLATVTLADPAFGASSGGTATAASANAVNAAATGVPGWYRVTDSDDNAIFDGSIGDGTLSLNKSTTVAGESVAITSFTVKSLGRNQVSRLLTQRDSFA